MLPIYKCEYIRDGGKVDNQVVDKQKGSLLMLANERGVGESNWSTWNLYKTSGWKWVCVVRLVDSWNEQIDPSCKENGCTQIKLDFKESGIFYSIKKNI